MIRYIVYMSYELNFTKSAQKSLNDLPEKTRQRIRKALEKLTATPQAASLDVKKLSGQSYYRLRVGDYRIIYDLQHHALVVLVLEVGHRREIYQ